MPTEYGYGIDYDPTYIVRMQASVFAYHAGKAADELQKVSNRTPDLKKD